MQIKRKTGRIIAYLLVLTLLIQYGINVNTNTVSASSNPTITAKSKDILVGQKYNLNISNKVKRSSYHWESSDTSIAIVNNRGFVTGLEPGKVKITCEVKTPNKTHLLKSNITVRKAAETIKINNKIEKIYVGDTYNLNKSILPVSSNDKTSWATSDSTIAQPKKNGIFTALKAGQVTITASTISGAKDTVTIRVLDESNSLTLTKDLIEEGKIILKDISYDYITIDSSVGNAEIILDNVTINDTLEMGTDAGYTVRAIESEINRVVSLEESKEESEDKISSFSIDKEKKLVAPTFIADAGTLVVTVDARGTVSIKQEGNAEIGLVRVSRKIDGKIELNLEGFSGNLIVNTISKADIDIVTKACNISEATISGTASGQKLSLIDNTANGVESNIDKIKVESSAQVKIDVPTKEMEIGESIDNASISVDKPIEKIVNSGSSTKLTINSNVSNIVSNGEKLDMRVTAGSTVKEIQMDGASSKVDVVLGSTVEKVVAKGNESSITGRGKVKEVEVEGNNTKIETRDTMVSVGEGVTGTVNDGKEIEAGTVAQPTPTSDPEPTPTPTPGTIPETGEVITIADPGDIWAGTEVVMKADYGDIRWSVYSYFEDNGYATIDSLTGVLNPRGLGTIRVVATSTLNPEVYGAVDLVIQGKKFVRVEPLEDVIIDSDKGLIGIKELQASNILPTKANLVYETGSGGETEILTMDLNNWGGNYDSSIIGENLLTSWIYPPMGYERPDNPYACVTVKVNASQSDNRILVNEYTNIDPITLTEDEHIVDEYHLYIEFLREKYSDVTLLNGEVLSIPVSGWGTEYMNGYDGEKPGTYNINTYIELPTGYAYKENFFGSDYVDCYYRDDIVIPVSIKVEKAQTPIKDDYIYNIPDATQTKIRPSIEAAKIEMISISGYPEVFVGEVIDFNKYLTVTTDSNKESDKRVIWSDIHYNYNEAGKYLFHDEDNYTIRATSVIDSTKYDEITISVVSNKGKVSYTPWDPIEVDKDMGINDIRTMYSALEDRLPRSLEVITKDNKKINISIRGWKKRDHNEELMELEPMIITSKGYDLDFPYPNLTINFSVPQTDNRIVVVSGSATTTNITLSEDRYATDPWYLMDAIYSSNNNGDNVKINATLMDGSIRELICEIRSVSAYYEDRPFKPYNGTSGKVVLELNVLLPEGYKALPSDNYSDFSIEVEVDIIKDQTSIYEEMWVTTLPDKMSYAVGEKLDLTGIMLRMRETTNSNVYIGEDEFSEYGLELYLGYHGGPKMSSTETITSEMNNKYIYIYNPVNKTGASLGPINVTHQDINVASGPAIVFLSSKISLSEDKHATSIPLLLNELYPDDGGRGRVPILATLSTVKQ